MNSFAINNPREYRILKALLKQVIFRKELNEIAGANNSPQNVKDMRNRSELRIPCERVEMTDGDGKKTRPERYRLTEQDKVTALEAIKKWEEGGDAPSLPQLDK